jgi:hypothetical protein
VFSHRWVGAFIIPIGVRLTDVLSEDSTSIILFDRHNFMDAVDNLLCVFSQRRVGACINPIGVRLTDMLSEDSILFVLFERHNFINGVNNLGVFSHWCLLDSRLYVNKFYLYSQLH